MVGTAAAATISFFDDGVATFDETCVRHLSLSVLQLMQLFGATASVFVLAMLMQVRKQPQRDRHDCAAAAATAAAAAAAAGIARLLRARLTTPAWPANHATLCVDRCLAERFFV